MFLNHFLVLLKNLYELLYVYSCAVEEKKLKLEVLGCVFFIVLSKRSNSDRSIIQPKVLVVLQLLKYDHIMSIN